MVTFAAMALAVLQGMAGRRRAGRGHAERKFRRAPVTAAAQAMAAARPVRSWLTTASVAVTASTASRTNSGGSA